MVPISTPFCSCMAEAHQALPVSSMAESGSTRVKPNWILPLSLVSIGALRRL
ncbi:hypothetical protein D3C85_1754300 [compost metagenome]